MKRFESSAELLEDSATFRKPTNVAPRNKVKWIRPEREADYSLRDVVTPQYTYDPLTFRINTASTEAAARQVPVEPQAVDRSPSVEPNATENPLDSEIDDSSPTQVSDDAGRELQDLSSENSVFLSSQIDRLMNAQPERVVETDRLPNPPNKRAREEMTASRPSNNGHVSVASTRNERQSKSPIAFLPQVTVDSFRRENRGAKAGVRSRIETIIKTSSNEKFVLDTRMSKELLKLTDTERNSLDNLLEYTQHNQKQGTHNLVDRTLGLAMESEKRLVSRLVSYQTSQTEDVHYVATAERPECHISDDQLLQIIDPFVLQSMSSK